jgi:DNA uptake protein ComE-like DNA-binding protein
VCGLNNSDNFNWILPEFLYLAWVALHFVKIKLNTEPVRSWFGFTRRERRSTSILLVIIFIIIGFRYLLPEKNIEIEDWGGIYADTEIIRDISEAGIAANPESVALFSSPPSRKAASGSRLQQKPLLDINHCDSLTLVAMPGIGPVLSARIIKYRNLLGGFANIEQLKEVYGLPEETYEMIKGRLYADTSGIRKIDVNSAGYKELSRIHYLEKYEVTAILKYREITGRVKSMQELKENKILAPEKAEKVEAYMDFR